jgi:hypothetical protein
MAMRTALAKQGFTPEFAAKTLMDAMRATVVRAIPNGKGRPVLRRFPDYRVRLQGYDRAWLVFGGNKPREAKLFEHELYGADRERLLAPPVDRKNLEGCVAKGAASVVWKEAYSEAGGLRPPLL